MTSYFKAHRSSEAMELLTAYPNAFALLYVIAYRAQRTAAFNRYNLKPGEALLGDHDAYGLSERQYRTAKQHLQNFNFATFKATSKGTIATLINARVFDINADVSDDQSATQATDGRRTGDDYQECKEGKEGETAPENSKPPTPFSLRKALAEEMLKP